MAAAAATATTVPRCSKREGDIAGAGTSVSLSDLLYLRAVVLLLQKAAELLGSAAHVLKQFRARRRS